MRGVQAALDQPWIRQCQAALALGVHRATVHNYLKDGRLRHANLGGSKLRSICSADVLELVLQDIERDERAGVDMASCSRTFAANIRDAVRATNTEHLATNT